MLFIRNIGELFGAAGTGLAIENGRIGAISAETPEGATVLDARGGAVIPGLIDSHTHLVFAGVRAHEFALRASGRTYLEIARAGGGILSTVAAVRRASLDELVELALERLSRMLTYGVTTIEVKSGYGLDGPNELKMLEAVRKLSEMQPIELVPTFLGAHTLPADYRDRRDDYIDLVTSDELMGRVAQEGLAEFCDAFCEESAFTIEESRRVLEAGKRHGLLPKIHADQLSQMGASRLAAEVGAVSAEHLEHIDDGGIAALKEGSVIAGLLPGCSFYLGVTQAPARRLLDAGVPVAIATDYNPGSSMVESLPLVLSIACTQMRMTPGEALVAATETAAAALRRGDRIGTIREGMQADLVLLDVPSVEEWLCQVGRNAVRAVIKKGHIVYERS
ncbi:MAG TPA: imidazolonepropionase [Vicinamibacteria bacterium]|nr:imidazolonepropionase [Vicinamibacteria bacterium]